MTAPAYSSLAQWYREGPFASYVNNVKSVGGMLDLLEAVRPAGDTSGPAVPDIVLCQDVRGGHHVSGYRAGGAFDIKTERGDFFLAPPNVATLSVFDTRHQIRALAFPMAQWQNVLDEATDGRFSFDSEELYSGIFASSGIRSGFQRLWALSEEEGVPFRLLAQAAGCHILAELCQARGKTFTPAKGGLAPWAQRRCVELMHARLAEDISLDELASEARLSSYHFARMFKQSVGVPPRVYLTRLRMERACELLEQTDIPITEIAHEVGYSSNQVLARIFIKHRHMSPSDYRRALRDPSRTIHLNAGGTALGRS